ncbi:MAG: molybdopterin-dependent oxidoreductase [Gammaproteobacteria bacterium]|nr:molybdopterin-dependent oxidoreductase [Gammaproteobacteria bacterium]
MSNQPNTSRRTFFKVVGLASGALAAGYYFTHSEPLPPLVQTDDTLTPNSMVQLTDNNELLFYCPRDEMGQGVTTGLATIIGEELDVNPSQIRVKFSGIHEDYNNPEFGFQGTGGSTSIKAHYTQLRQLAANFRALLIESAVIDLDVAKAELKTDNGQVLYGNKAFPYSQFIATAKTLEIPQHAKLKSATEFKYIGFDRPRSDALEKSNGTAMYAIDADLEGLAYAAVARCPVIGGTVASFDAEKARMSSGVFDIVQIETGIAVVANRYWDAKKAVKLIDIEWNLPELGKVGSDDIRRDYDQAMEAEDGDSSQELGDLDIGFAESKVAIDSNYWVPFLSHSPLEPMNAVVHIQGDKAEAWAGHQGAGGVAGLVARNSDVPVENVTVHSTFAGGSFGRRAFLSHVAEATQVAVATKRPIKLIWSREEDTQNGWFRPASLMRIKAGVSASGDIKAWHAKRVGGNIMPDTVANALPVLMPRAPQFAVDMAESAARSIFSNFTTEHASIEGLFEDYDVPNRKVNHVTVEHGLPLAFWRSVGHSFTAFAKEVAMDELAAKIGMNEVRFRLRNMKANPRLASTLEMVDRRVTELGSEQGRQWGFAAHSSFNSYVSEAAEVSIESGRIRVHRVVCALDCGRVINPDNVVSQMEGSIMFGLTAALYGNLELENGAIKQSNFHDYPILRMNEAPAVEVLLTESSEAPTGVGEPGLPPLAPAVANAVFKLTGDRLRELPLTLAS